jgi:hypothetical protein
LRWLLAIMLLASTHGLSLLARVRGPERQAGAVAPGLVDDNGGPGLGVVDIGTAR